MDFHFRPELAEQVREFCRRFLGYEGKPVELLDWQWKDVVLPLFGWRDADGNAKFKRGYVGICKKNGKSFLASLVAMMKMAGEGGHYNEVYSVASDKNQASIIYRNMVRFLQGSPLEKYCRIYRASKTIEFKPTQSFYRVLSSDNFRAEGINATCIIFDELHAQRTPALFDALKYATIARPKTGLFLSITTAGSDLESICYQEYTYAKRVLSGEAIDPHYFAYLAEAPEHADITKEETWRMANPSLGITFSVESFQADLQQALASDHAENTFRKYRLNQWVQESVEWIKLADWDKCNDVMPDLEELKGERCYAGLDLGSVDMSALVLYFPKRKLLLPYFWIPEGALKTDKNNKERYHKWERNKFLTLTQGDVIDFAAIREKILWCNETFDMADLAIDRYYATQLSTDLQGEGVNILGFGQGFMSMSVPAKELERLIISHQVNHGGNPILRWCIENTRIKTDDAGNIKPVRPKERWRKVDGTIAIVEALGRSLVHAESVYETGGLKTI